MIWELSLWRAVLDEIVAVAIGKAERNKHREFMIWSEEGVSL